MTDQGPGGPAPPTGPPPPPPPYAPPPPAPGGLPRWVPIAGIGVVAALIAVVAFALGRSGSSSDNTKTAAATTSTTIASTTTSGPRSTTTTTTTSLPRSSTTTTTRPPSTTTSVVEALRFRTITDETGMLSIDVPMSWTDVNGSVADDGPSLLASPDVEAWRNGWSTPGVRFFATTLFGAADQGDILDAWVPDGCTRKDPRQRYSTRGYEGMKDAFIECGGTGASVVNTVLTPTGRTEIVFVQVTMVGAADQRVLDRALASFEVGDISGGGAQG